MRYELGWKKKHEIRVKHKSSTLYKSNIIVHRNMRTINFQVALNRNINIPHLQYSRASAQTYARWLDGWRGNPSEGPVRLSKWLPCSGSRLCQVDIEEVWVSITVFCLYFSVIQFISDIKNKIKPKDGRPVKVDISNLIKRDEVKNLWWRDL